MKGYNDRTWFALMITTDLFDKQSHRAGRDRHWPCPCWLISPNGLYSQSWGTSFFRASSVGGQSSGTWATFCWLPWCVSRELDLKLRSWGMNWYSYGMLALQVWLKLLQHNGCHRKIHFCWQQRSSGWFALEDFLKSHLWKVVLHDNIF